MGEIGHVGIPFALVAAGRGLGRRGSDREGSDELGGVDAGCGFRARLGVLSQDLDADFGQGLGDRVRSVCLRRRVDDGRLGGCGRGDRGDVCLGCGEGLARGAGIGEVATTSSKDGRLFSSPVGSGLEAIDSSVCAGVVDAIIAVALAVGVEDAARMFTTEAGTCRRVRRGRIMAADSRGEAKRSTSR